MKRIIIYLLLIFPIFVFPQNLVPNSSFEEYHECPDFAQQIYKAKRWNDADSNQLNNASSIEYYNSCANISSLVNVPFPTADCDNIGFQPAHFGQAYAGLIFGHDIGPNEYQTLGYREYLECELNSSLIKEKRYCFSIWISAFDCSKFAASRQGVTFSDNWISQEDFWHWNNDNTQIIYPGDYQPYWEYTGPPITDTSSNWVRLEGSFIAKGGEKFMCIGNFYWDYPETVSLKHNGKEWSYYFIDNVAVWPCDAMAEAADAGDDQEVCAGEIVKLETTDRDEYHYQWYKAGQPEDTLSMEAIMYDVPTQSTQYVLKQFDFKWEITYDTVTIIVKDCDYSIPPTVYPNPTHDDFKMEFYQQLEGPHELIICNSLGQIMQQHFFTIEAEGGSLNIDLKNYASGVYYWAIRKQGKYVFRGKAVKI